MVGWELSQLGCRNPLKLLKTHGSGRQPMPLPQSLERVCLDILLGSGDEKSAGLSVELMVRTVQQTVQTFRGAVQA